MPKKTQSKSGQDVMGMMEEWFLKLPPLPENGRKNLVGFLPLISLIFGILGVIFGVAALGALTVLSPLLLLGAGVGHAGGSLVSELISLAGSVMLLAAYPGLKMRSTRGWQLLFWSQAVWVLSSLLSLSVMGLILDAVGFYLLYQIKSYYK